MYYQLIVILLSGVVIFYTDFKYRKIPNWVNLMIGLAGLAYMIFTQSFLLHLLGGLVPGLVLFLIAVKTKGFGMGDVKYVMASGLVLGLLVGINGLLYGVIMGAVYGLNLVIAKKAKAKDTFAYGPYLVMGNLLAIILEHDILGLVL